MVLQLRRALDLIDADLEALAGGLADLVQRHADTVMTGRTWMQHALPVTFGLKAAGWLDAVLRHQERLQALRPRVLALQFGGAAGTLASLGDKGMQVAQALAEELRLQLPDTPWHAGRDRMAEVACALGMLTGTLGKMARDLSLQMQTEVAELAEPAGAGRGGSSTMPHKRNPVGCAAVLACAARVPALFSRTSPPPRTFAAMVASFCASGNSSSAFSTCASPSRRKGYDASKPNFAATISALSARSMNLRSTSFCSAARMSASGATSFDAAKRMNSSTSSGVIASSRVTSGCFAAYSTA